LGILLIKSNKRKEKRHFFIILNFQRLNSNDLSIGNYPERYHS